MEKYYVKLAKMERKKYRKPLLSEALQSLAQLIGVVKQSETDALSVHAGSLQVTTDEEDAENNSLFSKFTGTKRPTGFFGTNIGDANNNSGEVNLRGKDHSDHEQLRDKNNASGFDKHERKRRANKDTLVNKSDQKGEPVGSDGRSPLRVFSQTISSIQTKEAAGSGVTKVRALTESNLSQFEK